MNWRGTCFEYIQKCFHLQILEILCIMARNDAQIAALIIVSQSSERTVGHCCNIIITQGNVSAGYNIIFCDYVT